jgi:hypothetical protein
MSEETEVVEQDPGAVELVAMVAEVTRSANDAAWYVDRQARNMDVFFTWWDGQSEDGRKHKEDLNAEPFPWEGASDTRIRLAEDICSDHCRLMQAALRGAQANLMPMEAGDEPISAIGTKVLRWLLRTGMARDVKVEAKLARAWRERHGASVTRVTWLEEIRLERKTFTVQDVISALEAMRANLLGAMGEGQGAMGVDPQVIRNDVMDLIFNLERAQEAAQVLGQIEPGVARKQWRKALGAWRRGEVAEVAVPYVYAQRPCWTAFRVCENIFFPAETGDLQKSPWIAVREWLSSDAVRSRDMAEDWSEGFADALLEHKGVSAVGEAGGMLQGTRWTSGGTTERLSPETQDLYELWTFYRKTCDEAGVPGVYVTVFHPQVRDLTGVQDELLDYAHGEYPFHEHRRETLERPILESRGVPELVMTWQSEIKAQRDARTDRADMESLPPVEAPTGSSRQRLDFGPGAVNYTRTPGSYRFMQISGNPQTSIEVEQRTKDEVNWFFGRIADNVPPARRQLCLQELVEDYFEEMTSVLNHTYQLAQQFLPPEVVARVCGDPKAGELWAQVKPADIRGRFDVKLRFDARDLDPELLELKMKVMNEAVIPADVAGVIDRAAYTKWQMYAIDSALAEEVVKPIENVTQAEVEDEQVQLAKIAGGLEPPMKESGQNAQLRLQVIQNSIQANPQLQQRMAQDPVYKQLIENRAKHFTFLLQQEQNKRIGKVGVSPTLGGG